MPTEAQRKLVFKTLDYAPTDAQDEVHSSNARIKLVAGGERSGKSKLTAFELLARIAEGRLYWLVALDYNKTRAEFEYLCEGLVRMGADFSATKRVDPGEIIVEGGMFRIATKSAKDPRSLIMEAPDGILACEAAQLDYESYLRLRGRLAEKRGWMVLSGTFESSLGWFPEMYNRGQVPENPEFRSFSMPTWSNTRIFTGGREDKEIKALEAASSGDWFMERFGGVPCPPKGRVFDEFSNPIHVGRFAFNHKHPVYVWVDPGYQHYYAVEVVQFIDGVVYIVDEIYEHGLVTSEIINICRQRPWWSYKTGGAIDINAITHSAMPAVTEIWVKEGGLYLHSNLVKIVDGIEVLKSNLKVNPLTNKPGIYIDYRCKGLISELGGMPNPHTNKPAVYRWKMDKEGGVVGNVPEDKNCDAIKATIYGLIDLKGYSTAQSKRALSVSRV